jgi:hypothetical protein
MLRRTPRRSGAIAAITSLVSVAVLISDAHFNVAQAQKDRAAAAVACGKDLQKSCTGVTVSGNNILECLNKDQERLSKRCAALANNIVHSCDTDASRRCPGNVAGQGNILACLTTARRSVSARCNAALDAAFLRR